MKKNIFIIGIDDFNLAKLKSLEDSANYIFHGLFTRDEVKAVDHYPLEKMLQKAEQILNQFSGTIDAIVGYWDFPVSDMVPFLNQKFGLKSATLESVVKCEHKYWSRIEQSQIIKEYVPRFNSVDPFDDNALSKIDIEYPFWIKPIRSVASYLGFRINNKKEFHHNIKIIRENISRFGEQFNYILQYVNMPEEISHVNGNICIAEEIISGRQCTLEGYVHDGKTHIYGIVDSIRCPNRSSFSRYQYPSKLPKRIKQEMCDCAKKVLSHFKLDNSPFNMEFFYNERNGKIFLLEINPRISQSHCDLFVKVDGTSHHKIMIDIALDKNPEFPVKKGRYNCAAKFMLRKYHDATVLRVPNESDIQKVKKEIPGTLVKVQVQEGMRLSQLMNQDSYSFEYAVVFIGAKNQQELRKNYKKCIDMLPFQFSD